MSQIFKDHKRGQKELECLRKAQGCILEPQNQFGLLHEDREFLERIINTIAENEHLSLFPDFLFDGGFIEHFQITSGVSNKHGSMHQKELSIFKRQVKEKENKLIDKINNGDLTTTNSTSIFCCNNIEHSHQNLIKSFKNSWEHHLKSLKKYEGNSLCKIFMVEYDDQVLAMYENVYDGWLDGMSHGDMRNPEKHSFYRLSRDVELLNYVYSFKDFIDYVIFVSNRCEIIKVENIPYFLKLMPWEYKIYPKNMYIQSTMQFLGSMQQEKDEV